ncbi:MAG: hypothetical protein LAQ69_38945 [Acidobacteriia bacterium]|nr:hypothetical protein [Terriglobia bacterium]
MKAGARGWELGAGLGVASLLACAGCGRYAEFTLPPVSGGDPHMTFAFEAQPAPVLTRGEGWESRDVLNPSVTRGAGPPPALLNLYSGYDGHTWHTGLASSDDGLRWLKHGRILSPDPQTWEGSYIAANGSALFHLNQIWYWYVAGAEQQPRLGLARSPEGGTWRKEPGPVLEPGPYASWDERGVADPYVIRIDPYFYLYYLGQDRARRQRLGVARSADGVHWVKLRSNPILELGDVGAFDEAGLGEPAVWCSHASYWMLYTGLDPEKNRRLGLARSTDGVHWEKLPVVLAGSEAWDSKVVCDPTVLVDGATIRVWFGGGDVASPDENLHGQIGFGILRPITQAAPYP